MKKQVPNLISDKRRLLEIVAVFLTGFGKFIFMDLLDWKLPFICTIMIGWFLYILVRAKTDPKILNYWGLTSHNFKATLLKVLPFGALAIVACVIVGSIQETINLTWHIIPVLLLYPIWGTIQQLLMIGLVAGNLQDLKSKSISNPIIIIVTATLFALVHYPSYWLMFGTFILALFYSFIYLKIRNVFVLGLFHGWLGAFFYYMVLNRDPFLEAFGKYL